MSALPKNLTSPPPQVPNTLITFPHPQILVVTLNRPSQLNAIPTTSHALLEALWNWYDAQPSLRCAVLTGTGRGFCAGADLKEWDARNAAANNNSSSAARQQNAPVQTRGRMAGGFGGMSNRAGKKPIVAAVNGLCLGGGMEMAVNCDLVVASREARFALPEVQKGVVALAGALPRIARTLGKQRASEMALVGGMYTAEKMLEWGLVNSVVDKGDVLGEALRFAEAIAGNSPDSVIVSKEGLRLGWEGMGPEMATNIVDLGLYGRIDAGENMTEGVVSFVEKRKPVWKDSKL